MVRSCEGDSSCAGAQHWSQYVYDASGRVLARFNAQSPGSVANSFLSELYVYAGKRLVAVVDFNASHPQGAVLWLHTDGQGSLRRVSDSMADVVRSVSWTPFGAVRSDTGVTNQDGLGYAWQSAAYDKQSVVDVGLRARHADYGWFLSPDPVAWGDPMDPQSFHRSQYARGSPMTLVDPSGGGPEMAVGYAAILTSMLPRVAHQQAYASDNVPIAAAWAGIAATSEAFESMSFGEKMIVMMIIDRGIGAGLEPAASKGGWVTDDRIRVTPDGVALPKGGKYSIPEGYVEPGCPFNRRRYLKLTAMGGSLVLVEA